MSFLASISFPRIASRIELQPVYVIIGKNMPITFILLLIYIAAIVIAFIGLTKKIIALKIISAFLFLIGITLTIVVVISLKSM